jgi:MarR family transcriptional regulator, lower aerobic nicotinate degradation pathway regulator
MARSGPSSRLAAAGGIPRIATGFRGLRHGPRQSLRLVADGKRAGVAGGLHDEEIYGKPGHLIRRLQQIAVAIFVAETRAFEITPVQYASLLAVQLHPGIDQTALMEAIAFDLSTIGEVVGRLQGKGLVKRRVSPKDRRAKVLYITAAGRRLLAQIEPRVEAAQERILAPLPRADQGPFMRALKHIVEANNEFSRVPLRRKPSSKAPTGVNRKMKSRRG